MKLDCIIPEITFAHFPKPLVAQTEEITPLGMVLGEGAYGTVDRCAMFWRRIHCKCGRQISTIFALKIERFPILDCQSLLLVLFFDCLRYCCGEKNVSSTKFNAQYYNFCIRVLQ